MSFFRIWALTSVVIFHTYRKKKIIIIKNTVNMLQNNKLVEERTECEVGKSEVES